MRRVGDEEDKDMINSWLKDQGLNECHSWPEIGFIDDDMSAVAFLIKTDTDMACIDFVISNPNAPMRKRSAALDEVIQAVVNEAYVQGFNFIKGSTKYSSLLKRTRRMGFVDAGKFDVVVKRLGGLNG